MPSSVDDLQHKLDRHIDNERTQLVLDDFVRHATLAKIPIRPEFLREICLGGLRAGDTMLSFGRPGAGKTMLAVNTAASIAYHGERVLYCGNEESREANGMRFLSLMGKESLHDMNALAAEAAQAAVGRAYERAMGVGFDRLHFCEQLDMEEIEQVVERIRPKCLVLDQIRNLDRNAEQTAGLENAMRWLRKVAIQHDLIGIATAQAFAGSEGKEVLGLTDLDSSKTGVQGACDLMVGVGVSDELRHKNMRCLSVCRNKVSGIIQYKYVQVDEQHSRIMN